MVAKRMAGKRMAKRMAGSILPVTIHDNKLYFLFGKENPLEDSAPGWSDFGGGVEGKETPYQTALREGGEELTGFLGDHKTLLKTIKKNGGIMKLHHETYHMHLFFMEYDENLPKYYNQNHAFLWNRMDHQVLNKTKLFEKIEIKWFSEEELKSKRTEFRGFYQPMVDLLCSKRNEIETFIIKNGQKNGQKNEKKNRSIYKRNYKNRTRKQKSE